jgi:hypothetical protein
VHHPKAPAPAEAPAGQVKTKGASKATQAYADGSQSAAPAGNWVPYRVMAAVEAPSGRKHVADTVRFGPPPAAERR